MKLISTFLLALALLSATGRAAGTNAPPVAKSRVVAARDLRVVTGLRVDAAKTRALVAAGIKALTGQTDEAAAWRAFASSNDVVGIKISTLAAPLHATHREVVNAIAAGLASAGVAPTNIIVWDRDPRKMREAGYFDSDKTLWRAVSVVGDTGWDALYAYETGLVGKLIWGDLLFGQEELLATRSHLPKLLTQHITKLINVPVLIDDDPCGIAGCLYNVSLTAVDNSRRFEQTGQTGNPFIAEIAAMAPIRSRLVLNIMDALIAGYAGGPVFKPQYSFPHGTLYFSRDPVAVDTVCLELLEDKRKAVHVPAIAESAGHVTTAGKLGLGQSDRANIDLIEVAP